MENEIYLDNAATTRCDEEILTAMHRVLTEDYGNPSSMHRKGYEAEQLLKKAGEDVAAALSVRPQEICFTSCGTEGDNLALFGAARANARKGKHIVISAIEHAAVAEAARALAEEGFEISIIPVNEYGIVDPEEAAALVRPDTVLVSVMTVNNEIGTTEDLPAIVRAVKEKAPGVLVHTDAVQAFGKMPLSPARDGIDLLAVSGHKLHAPKGTGFLYVRKGVKLTPILYGGGQQDGRRPGTDNVPGAVAVSLAAVKSVRDLAERSGRMAAMRDGFVRKLYETLPEIRVNGPAGAAVMPEGTERDRLLAAAAPHIVSLSVPGVRAEVLLHALEDKGIYVSAGSACSSHAAKKQPGTATLRAIGLPAGCLASTVRFSFSGETTREELDKTVQALAELVPTLRRFS